VECVCVECVCGHENPAQCGVPSIIIGRMCGICVETCECVWRHVNVWNVNVWSVNVWSVCVDTFNGNVSHTLTHSHVDVWNVCGDM